MNPPSTSTQIKQETQLPTQAAPATAAPALLPAFNLNKEFNGLCNFGEMRKLTQTFRGFKNLNASESDIKASCESLKAIIFKDSLGNISSDKNYEVKKQKLLRMGESIPVKHQNAFKEYFEDAFK